MAIIARRASVVIRLRKPTTLMPANARQHWVPQSYLRRFAFDQKGRRVCVFDKTTGTARTMGVGDVCQREFLYESWLRDETVKADPEARSGMIEQELGRSERALNEMTKVAERIAHGGGGTIEERVQMAIAIAVQTVRTPRFRDDLLAP